MVGIRSVESRICRNRMFGDILGNTRSLNKEIAHNVLGGGLPGEVTRAMFFADEKVHGLQVGNKLIDGFESIQDLSHKDLLQCISHLRAGANAKILVKNGEYETKHDPGIKLGEEVYQGGFYGSSSPWGSLPGEKEIAPHDYTVEIKAPVYEPDTEKQQAANALLKIIYEKICWLPAKLLAGTAISDQEMLDSLSSLSWNTISKSFFKPENKELEALEDLMCLREHCKYILFDLPAGENYYEHIFLYEGKIFNAVRQYFNNSKSLEVRRKAANILGYSPSKIWFHELLISIKNLFRNS